MEEFLKEQLDLSYFREHGYSRNKCTKCGAYFWTLNKEDTVCGDQPCVPFSFINKPLGSKPFNLHEVRESFLSYFESKDHTRLHYPVTGERMPVIARWRSDIYLTIASIADFQPHITSGIVPPPANPLVISQPCIRLNDLDEVGRSGRHLTMFEMMGHHAFNKHTDEIYWKNETVFYCDEYFTKKIGIPKEKITYKEQLWFGGGNAGPCLEVLAGGLEIATLVFMNMKADDQGEYIIENERYSPNPLNIVDTGYGLERIAWITQGTKQVYETVFPEIINWIKEKTMGESDDAVVYSLADHSKTLSFMLGDGIVPSNVKAGYLARLLIRRSLRFIEQLKLDIKLKEIVLLQLEHLQTDFPSLIKEKNHIAEMLDIETKRYYETVHKGEQLVKRLIQQHQSIDDETLIRLYDTHGMPPSIVKSIAQKEGVHIEIPDDFESKLAELHTHETKQNEDEVTEKRTLPSTHTLFTEDHYRKEFQAKVLQVEKKGEEYEVILDQTAFYPEGGGQLHDVGYLQTENGETRTVINVIRDQESILHYIDGPLDEMEQVKGFIDWERRYTLMKHHTGTHVINGALRTILGDHIWQAGSQLGIEDARFDYAHYQSLSDKEISQIEDLANSFIKKGIEVQKLHMERNNAEETFGFRLYQGGVPPGDMIRVLNIPEIDVEACGGTHVNNIAEIEKIRIIKSERIQDGVNRIVFAAGHMVDAYKKEEQELYYHLVEILAHTYKIQTHDQIPQQIQQISTLFSVPHDQLQKTLHRFLKETKLQGPYQVNTLLDAGEHLFSEWKKSKKQGKTISGCEIEQLKEQAEVIPGTSIKLIIGTTTSNSIAVVGAIIAEDDFIVHLYDGKKITSGASENISIDFSERIANEIGAVLGGSGGGKPRLTQSGGPKKDQVEKALQLARNLTIQTIQ